MCAEFGFLVVRELKNIAVIGIRKFSDLFKGIFNFVIDLSRM